MLGSHFAETLTWRGSPGQIEARALHGLPAHVTAPVVSVLAYASQTMTCPRASSRP